MVNLTTTYDTLIHKKVFVLKGEEAYARSTSVIASLVTFTDSESYMSNARYGLAIRVLRNIGDSSIVIYDNGKLLRLNDGSTLESIEWYEDMDNATIPDGMTWDSATQTLTIGLDTTDEDYLDTGIALFYNIEHNIVVKYLGNESCLKSKSPVISKTIDTPTVFNTSVNVTSTKTSYYQGETDAVVTATLLDGDENPIPNQSLLVYIDDEATGETVTTGDDGSYDYSLSVGLHEYEFRYLGLDNFFFASTGSLSVSYGYLIVGESSDVWINGIGHLDVTVTDYFGNFISGLEVSCVIDGSNTITATTDSSGNATLSNNTTGLVISSSVTITDTYNDESDTIPINNVLLTNYDINGATTETWINGSALPLTVSATGTDSGGTATSVEGLVVELTNATPSTVTLDSNGQATCYYNPSGAGDVTVTANFQDVASDTVGITDYHTVWANSQIYNGYSAMSNCYRQILSTGWYLRSNSSSSASKLYWYKSNGVQFDSFWASFDVVSVDSNTTSINVCGASITVSAGSSVTFRRTLNPLQDTYLVYVWVDGSLANYISYEGTPYVGFNSASTKGFTFNNLKIKTL